MGRTISILILFICTLTNALTQTQLIIDGVYFKVDAGDSLKFTGNMTVKNRGHLQIESGGRVAITGAFTLKADVDTSGSLRTIGSSTMIDLGTLTVSGTRTFQAAITKSNWHYISIPVASATYGVTSGLLFEGNNNMYRYNETGTFSGLVNGWVKLAGGDALSVMKGYDLLYARNKLINFTGLSNTGNQSLAVTYTASGGRGWNLMGNPYPSFIDWDASSGWTKTNIDNAVYYTVNNGYASYVAGVGTNGGTRYISPMQGFFVHATAAGSLGTNDNVRVWNTTASAVNYLKSGSEINQNLLRILASSDSLQDESYLRFTPEATEAFDGNWDAYKLFAKNSNMPQIYSINTEGTEFSINSIQPIPIDTPDSIALGFTCGLTGQYTLLFEENKVGSVSSDITLEDKLAGTFTDLRQTNMYQFPSEPTSGTERFMLHFNSSSNQGGNDIGTIDGNNRSLRLYSCGQNIYINAGIDNNQEYKLQVYNLQGQLIIQQKLTGNEVIPTNLSGIYLVRITSYDHTITSKIRLWP